MTDFVKQHRCEPCGTSWEDVWSCLCDDDCPTCGRPCEPLEYEEEDN